LNIPITLTTLLVCQIFLAEHAGAQSHTAAVTVNIRFLPVQTITVQTSQQTTDLVYATPEDYENGVAINQDDHLTVFSSGGFQVTVAGGYAGFSRSGGSETIPVSDVIVRAGDGSNSGTHARYTEATLSATSVPIIESEGGGRNLKYNVTYDNRIAGLAQKYIDKYVSSDGVETVYSTNVTYTITTR
jgi:hypothetical protein